MTIIYRKIVRGMAIKTFLMYISVAFSIVFAIFFVMGLGAVSIFENFFIAILGGFLLDGMLIYSILSAGLLKKRERYWCLIDDSVGFNDFNEEWKYIEFEDGLYVLEKK